MAAFMASGEARFTGKPGVCIATSGPGAIHLLNGLYDAKLDHTPVVAIMGQQPQSALGGWYQQEVDLHSLFKDVAADFIQTAHVPEQFPNLIDRAMRIAADRRTVTCVIIPEDVQEQNASGDEPPHAFKMVPGMARYDPPRAVPPEDQLQTAAAILNEGKKVAILVGNGARGATDEVLEVAELLGAGVAKALLGISVVPDDVPFVTGPIGLLGSKPSYDMMMGCDTFLKIGTNFPYVQFLPEWDQAKGVEIEIDGALTRIRYPFEVSLIGDSKATLEALIPMLERKADRSWQKEIAGNVESWWKVVEARAMNDAKPINPQRVFWELNGRIPDNTILTSDSGSAANWFARDIKKKRGMMSSLSGTLATMGPGVPHAIGAKFSHPDRLVIALVGDGAMQMNGMAELLTIVKYYKQWSDPRLVVLVLNNGDLNQVSWEMRAMEGDPKNPVTQDLPPMNYARFADLIGLQGIRVESPEDIGPAWDKAFASDVPTVIDALTDPDVAPIPPHAELAQIKAMTKAVLRGDPDARHLIAQGIKDKLEEFKPANR
jgi:pyruvate dehydrogenase (quinone)